MPDLIPTIETARLILRPWREEDRGPFATMNADPEVRRFFPTVLSRSEADAFFDMLVTGIRSSVPMAGCVLGNAAYGATIRDRGTGSTKVRAGRSTR